MMLAPQVPWTVQRLTLSDGLAGTWETVGLMRRLAREGSRDARVRQSAVNLIFNHPPKVEGFEISVIFDFVRDSIRYVRDPLHFESVAYPAQTLALRYGDCDDKATLLAAMLESIGYPTRFVIAGYNAPSPEHVYIQVLVNGQWVDADATESQAIGYAPPNPIFLDFERV